MAFFRTVKKENPYVQIEKTFIEDETLSWGAKGLMVYILSRPDGWKIYREDLQKRSTDKRDKVENYIYELMAAGYIFYYAIRDGAYKIEEWVYEVYESPEYNPNLEESIAKGKEMIQNKKDRNKRKVAKRKEKEKAKEPEVELPHQEDESKKPHVELPHQELPHQEIPHYINNNGIKNKDIKNKDSKKNLSIEEKINSLQLPSQIVSRLLEQDMIDRLLFHNKTVKDIETVFNAYREKLTIAKYIKIVVDVLNNEKKIGNLQRYLTGAVETFLENEGNKANNNKQTVREEMVPEWLHDKKQDEKPKEDAKNEVNEEMALYKMNSETYRKQLTEDEINYLKKRGLWKEPATV